MLCRHCGHEVPDSANFCTFCGKKIIDKKIDDLIKYDYVDHQSAKFEEPYDGPPKYDGDATRRCPYCGQEISVRSQICGFCGKRIKKNKVLAGCLIALGTAIVAPIVIIFAGAFFSGVKEALKSPPSASPSRPISQSISEAPSSSIASDAHSSDVESSASQSSSVPASSSKPSSSSSKSSSSSSPSSVLPSSSSSSAPSSSSQTIPEDSTFEIHFIDVGQADAALVICDGKAMLIDGGDSGDSSRIYSYLKNQGVTHLNYIVATHAHEDHVGGLSGALNYATVGTAFCPVRSYDSEAFKDFVKYLGKQNVSITIPSAGQTFKLGSASVQILGLNGSAEDHNNASIILRIVYGDTSFLFTGDANREAEQAVLNAGYALDSTVLKVGHHGSNNSTTYPFLREISPDYAVISVGSGNSYGHPTEATLSRLRDADVKVFRTDMQGNIICTSDGEKVSFSVSRNSGSDTLTTPPSKSPSSSKPTSSSSSSSQAPSRPISSSQPASSSSATNGEVREWIANKNTLKFHYPSCSSVKTMSEKNKVYFTATRDEIIALGYDSCQNCNP